MTRSLCVGLFLVVVCVVGLYQVKYRVQNIKRDLVEMYRQLAEDKEAIRVLRAEWAYLNQPERLKVLVDTHLAMVPVEGGALLDDGTLSAMLVDEDMQPRHYAATPILKPTLSRFSGIE